MTRLSSQQRAVLDYLDGETQSVSTRELERVRAPIYVGAAPAHPTYPIGEPVGAVLRRLAQRGLVHGTREVGLVGKWWRITDKGRQAFREAA